MPTPMTHAFVAVALGKTVYRRKPLGFWLLAILCATLPDIDTIGLRLGIPYGHVLGHRGLTHSLFFAACLSAAAAWAALPWFKPAARSWWRLWLFFFVVAASQGVLDAMTDGGMGVAFFAPFHNARYFLPFCPIEVSPIGLGAFLSQRGLRVLSSELLWVCLPMGLLVLAARVWRARGAERGR